MTSSGRSLALLIALVIVFLLPKRVVCGYPSASCVAPGERCTPYEVEPLGFYLLEHLAKRDIGFAYKSDAECR